MAVCLRHNRILFGASRSGIAHLYNLHRIGNREVVGYGLGSTVYVDSFHCPLPAIRYQEDTPHVTKLRAIEAGPWTKLSLDDKKMLYRSSFRQTFAEFQAPTGIWKLCVAGSCLAFAFALNAYTLLWNYVYEELPVSFEPEHQKAQLIRMILLNVQPVEGLSSRWDYENMKWK